MTEIAIGIDPGTNTGFAVWNITEQRFESISCLKIHQALDEVFLANNKDKKSRLFLKMQENENGSAMQDGSNFRVQVLLNGTAQSGKTS